MRTNDGVEIAEGMKVYAPAYGSPTWTLVCTDGQLQWEGRATGFKPEECYSTPESARRARVKIHRDSRRHDLLSRIGERRLVLGEIQEEIDQLTEELDILDHEEA